MYYFIICKNNSLYAFVKEIREKRRMNFIKKIRESFYFRQYVIEITEKR